MDRIRTQTASRLDQTEAPLSPSRTSALQDRATTPNRASLRIYLCRDLFNPGTRAPQKQRDIRVTPRDALIFHWDPSAVKAFAAWLLSLSFPEGRCQVTELLRCHAFHVLRKGRVLGAAAERDRELKHQVLPSKKSGVQATTGVGVGLS